MNLRTEVAVSNSSSSIKSSESSSSSSSHHRASGKSTPSKFLTTSSQSDENNWTEVTDDDEDLIVIPPDSKLQPKLSNKTDGKILIPFTSKKANCNFVRSVFENNNNNNNNNNDGDDDGSKKVGNLQTSNDKTIKGQDKLSNLLDLGFQNVRRIPNLTRSDFQQLDESAYDKLNLSHNCLRKIPLGVFSKFPQFEQLLVLDLSCNQLTYLPNDLDSLVNLTHLNLFLNKLKCLTPSLGKLRNLTWLNLSKNPDLLKWSYFCSIAGPMSNDEECHECATNVISWVQDMSDRGKGVKEWKTSHQNEHSQLEKTSFSFVQPIRQNSNQDEEESYIFDAHLIRMSPPNDKDDDNYVKGRGIETCYQERNYLLQIMNFLTREPSPKLLSRGLFLSLRLLSLTLVIIIVFAILQSPSEFEQLLNQRFSFISTCQQDSIKVVHEKIYHIFFWFWTSSAKPSNPSFWNLFLWYFQLGY